MGHERAGRSDSRGGCTVSTARVPWRRRYQTNPIRPPRRRRLRTCLPSAVSEPWRVKVFRASSLMVEGERERPRGGRYQTNPTRPPRGIATRGGSSFVQIVKEPRRAESPTHASPCFCGDFSLPTDLSRPRAVPSKHRGARDLGQIACFPPRFSLPTDLSRPRAARQGGIDTARLTSPPGHLHSDRFPLPMDLTRPREAGRRVRPKVRRAFPHSLHPLLSRGVGNVCKPAGIFFAYSPSPATRHAAPPKSVRTPRRSVPVRSLSLCVGPLGFLFLIRNPCKEPAPCAGRKP